MKLPILMYYFDNNSLSGWIYFSYFEKAFHQKDLINIDTYYQQIADFTN